MERGINEEYEMWRIRCFLWAISQGLVKLMDEHMSPDVLDAVVDIDKAFGLMKIVKYSGANIEYESIEELFNS